MSVISFTLKDQHLYCKVIVRLVFSLYVVMIWQISHAAAQDDKTKIFLMGEIHDNSFGHKLRFDHVKHLIAQGHRLVLAMEQFDRENQPQLDAALNRCKHVDCVLAMVATSSWDWDFYKGFIQLALDKKVTLIAANLSSKDVYKVMVNGFSAVFAQKLIIEYKLNQIPIPLLNAQKNAIDEGHCKALPSSSIEPMARGQIARDVWMAHVINGLQNQTVVLLAGNGHIRKDIGVFQWLGAHKQLLTQTHGYVEEEDIDNSTRFDRVNIVTKAKRSDPCLAFTHKSINRR